MTDAANCSECGLILAPNAPRGLCPGCLFKRVFETQGLMTGADLPFQSFEKAPPTPQELEADFPELEILRFVGRGGMGMVYQARQKQLNRMVALKILSPAIARDPAFAERFTREAQMMALLAHPRLVTIFEFGTKLPSASGYCDTPMFFLLMEYVDGLTLRQLLDASQLTPPQAFAIVPQICEALQYAHDKGVVHRDIKPENILLDRQGNVKIADFGLAKLMGLRGRDVTISTTGQVLGTLHYMAPEQLERPLEVDHRADIFSLGVVFYQMLTGELPLGRFAPPSQKVLVDVRMDEVVLRALEREPGRRYQQANALREQIETISETSSTGASNPTRAVSRYRSWLLSSIGKHRKRLGIVGVILIGAIAGNFTVNSQYPRKELTNVHLADRPDELRRVTTELLIKTGLERPISPWVWQELERRTLTDSDSKAIIDGLIDWLHRKHSEGMPEPFHWLDHFLETLDGNGLLAENQKIMFLEALHGDLRSDRSIRLREGMQQFQLNVEWRWNWNRELLGMVLLNEVQSLAVDDEPILLPDDTNPSYLDQTDWDLPTYHRQVTLPLLTPGKHTIRLRVLSALIPKNDLTGLKRIARFIDWPPAKKLWTRTLDIEVQVFPQNVEIIRRNLEPLLDPASIGLKVETIIIRNEGERTLAILKFSVDQKLRVPISFNVSLRFNDQSIQCGSLWETKTNTNKGASYRGTKILTVEISEISPDVKNVDVVLTPNPQWIELQPEVDCFWGKDVVFKNVVLRRLDLEEPNAIDN